MSCELDYGIQAECFRRLDGLGCLMPSTSAVACVGCALLERDTVAYLGGFLSSKTGVVLAALEPDGTTSGERHDGVDRLDEDKEQIARISKSNVLCRTHGCKAFEADSSVQDVCHSFPYSRVVSLHSKTYRADGVELTVTGDTTDLIRRQ